MNAPPQDWKRFQVERIEQERKRVQDAHGDIGLKILDILSRHDPLCMVCEANPGEYAPEVGTIVPKLEAARCVEDVRRIVYGEFTYWFGIRHAGPASRYDAVGEAIWDAWRQRTPHRRS